MVRAIVGANWGDEGKGKITDMLAKESDIIVRFQGGSNAGHTIINNYGKFALHLLPSGVFYNHTTSIIGNGVALNIPFLVKELNDLTSQGVPMPKILVSDRAQILMPYHILFDTYEEARLAGKSFGSTKSGIAPFYSDKYAKIGFQVNELFGDEKELMDKIENVCTLKNVMLEHLYHQPALDPKEIFNTLMEYKEMVAPYVCDTSKYLRDAIKAGKNVLLEGQLGSLKDPDHGIYPMVTSSSTLAGYGATVIVNYNGSAAKAEKVVNEITANGGMAESMQCSVSDFEKSKEMIDGIVKKYGRLDILVNNAGITKDNLIMKMSEDDFDAVIATNLKGAFNCIKHVSRQMLKQRGGRIINISSVSGVMGNAGQANYCASKAGIIGLTKSVARELGSRGITSNAVAPGFIRTEMTDVLPEDVKKAMGEQIPLKHFGETKDIAEAVAFLASDEAAYITGQVLHVDGGMAM